MLSNRYIQSAIASAFILMFAATAWADNIDDALKAAYKKGYEDGYRVGKGGGSGGGGSQGSANSSVPHRGGGTSSYKYTPRAEMSDEKTNKSKLNSDLSPKATTQKLDEKALINKFKAYNNNTGTIVNESMKFNNVNELGVGTR